MILFRSKISRELEELLDSIPGQDPGEVSFQILEFLVKNAKKIRPGDIEKAVGELSRFSFIGPMCVLFNILRSVVGDKFDKKIFKDKIGMVYRIYSEMYNANQDALQSYFLQALKHDSVVATTGYSRSLSTALLYGRSKIRTVYVIEGFPLKPGKMLAVELRKAGMQSYHIPEDFVYWMVNNSTVAVIPVYGISSKGWLTVDIGGTLLAYTAKEKGIEVIGLTLPLFTCKAHEDALLPNRVIMTRRMKKRERTIRFAAYDHLNPEILDKLVTYEGITYEVGGEELASAATQGARQISTIINEVLRVEA